MNTITYHIGTFKFRRENKLYEDARKADITIKRLRFSSINGMNEQKIKEIGHQLSRYFIEQLPTDPKKNRKETALIIDRIPNEIELPSLSSYIVQHQ